MIQMGNGNVIMSRLGILFGVRLRMINSVMRALN